MTETMDANQPSATIYSFPTQPRDRLRLAARRLEEALHQQAEALRALRGNLAALGGAVGGLHDSLMNYQGNLATTAATTAAAHAEARAMESRADAILHQLPSSEA